MASEDVERMERLDPLHVPFVATARSTSCPGPCDWILREYAYFSSHSG
jgi:hypothetical protein